MSCSQPSLENRKDLRSFQYYTVGNKPKFCLVEDVFLNSIIVSRKRKSLSYRKISKISPGAYIFQRPFLRGLFLKGLIFGGVHVRREICVSKSIELACSGKEMYNFFFVLFCIRGQFPSTNLT